MASDIATGSVTQVTRVARPEPAAQKMETEPRSNTPSAGDSPVVQRELARDTLQEAMVRLSDLVQSHRRSLQFSVDEASGRTVIRVLDAETQETIRQIPAEEVINVGRWLKGSTGGLISTRV